MPRRHRHGELRHASKHDEIALQAADVLAYEEYRYLTGARDRWQREMLHANSQVPLKANMNDRFMRMMVQRAKLDDEQARRLAAP